MTDLTLYLVTDSAVAAAAGHTLPAVVAAGVAGGVTAVQVREKNASRQQLLDVLGSVAEVLPAGVPLVVNDDVTAFLDARAAGIAVTGVHVGQDDDPVEDVRAAIGPDALLGLSAATPAELAVVDPAIVDHVGIGALHGTPTKTDAPPALGLEGMRERVALAAVPAVAIGGVTVADARALHGSGLAGLAVVSGICGAADPEAAARAYRVAWTGADR
ncbi:thiamine phosphate synthase [Aeromicrobium sp. Leaf350]|uniref:thiamine phosphate synthase n=1 Tax=Aeromicrobium sp. Leaf350 TaxID=2876565 RepID=UPI001E5A624C|nr:thiamine phosphate synthase [Aeromicrobium sp. Leaf350]